MRIRFVCPHCKVARTWASSRVLAGHCFASQKQVAMLMYCTTSSNNFACTPCMQAHPCLYLCWHVCHLSSLTFASLVWYQNLFGVH